MGLDSILGSELIKNDGTKVSTSSIESTPVIALYFSAHWCPPCKMFTPKLKAAYEEANADGKKFEVVFISADQSEEEFQGYFESMPWLAPKFDEDELGEISEQFGVSSIPALIVIDSSGAKKTDNAKTDIMNKGAAAIEGWM